MYSDLGYTIFDAPINATQVIERVIDFLLDNIGVLDKKEVKDIIRQLDNILDARYQEREIICDKPAQAMHEASSAPSYCMPSEEIRFHLFPMKAKKRFLGIFGSGAKTHKPVKEKSEDVPLNWDRVFHLFSN